MSKTFLLVFWFTFGIIAFTCSGIYVNGKNNISTTMTTTQLVRYNCRLLPIVTDPGLQSLLQDMAIQYRNTALYIDSGRGGRGLLQHHTLTMI